MAQKSNSRPIEPQYQRCFEHVRKRGRVSMGVMHSHSWETDPRHLVFTLSRYKFVSKLLSGREDVLEIGCADAFASRLVLQEVGRLTVSDFDPLWIDEASKQSNEDWPFEAIIQDIVAKPMLRKFDAIYALDVLEHIRKPQETRFLRNIMSSLSDDGILVLGTPSAESQKYASPAGKEGHVNCKTGMALRTLIEKYFHSTFVFSMNDEVVHTGYYPMAHYLIALGCHKRC